MDTATSAGFAILCAITLYCLVWLWRRPASLLAKLFWTLVCVSIPAFGLYLMLEFFVPVTSSRKSGQIPPGDSHFPDAPRQLPPEFVSGLLAIFALIYGGLLLLGGLYVAFHGHPVAWTWLWGGAALLLLGAYFLVRGRHQIEAANQSRNAG